MKKLFDIFNYIIFDIYRLFSIRGLIHSLLTTSIIFLSTIKSSIKQVYSFIFVFIFDMIHIPIHPIKYVFYMNLN
jgi:hypothetical protein